MSQPYYETMYILRPDIPEEEVETHVNKYRDLVTESGGVVLDTQMRGKRRLAYPIAKHREGIYVQLNHNGDGQQVAPLERAMRLSEDVIRYLTVKQDGPMPAPRSLPNSGGGESVADATEVVGARRLSADSPPDAACGDRERRGKFCRCRAISPLRS